MNETPFDESEEQEAWPDSGSAQLAGHDSAADDEAASGLQLTLGEMFLLVTLTAVGLWLYQYVDPLLAMLCGGAVLFFAIMKAVGRKPLVVGGLIGCVTAFLIALLIGLLFEASKATLAAVLAISPCCGYIVGGAITELNGDDEL